MMKTHVFKKIRFDESFPAFEEDLDLFKRTQTAGYGLLFDPHISERR
jgi:hypothetical protein